MPVAIAYNPNNNYLYVANHFSGSVSVINAATNSVDATLTGFGYLNSLAFNSANGNIYAADDFNCGGAGCGAIHVINGLSVVSTIPVPYGPGEITFIPVTGDLYSTSFQANSTFVIDSGTNALGPSVPVGFPQSGAVFNPATGLVYVHGGSGMAVAVDPLSNSVVGAPIPLGGPTGAGVYNPDNQYVYVTNFTLNSVSVIDGSTNTVVGTIPVGQFPLQGAVYNPSNSSLYISNYADGTISVITTNPPPLDTDGDGVPDLEDNCLKTPNPGQEDTDGNGRGDACEKVLDKDRDGDGIPDRGDNCPDVYNRGQQDSDIDGIGDVCDPTPEGESDIDGDGILDMHDNCVDVHNPGQENTYGGPRGDACEPPPLPDGDHDGVPDLLDNCPDRPNPSQVDTDGDGTGDLCDPTPEGEPVAPSFSQPFELPDDAACLCTPVLMNLNSTGTQHWWVKADSTGTGVVGMRTFAVSVNNVYPETVEVHVYDAGGTEVAGSPVSTGYPAGTAPGTETFTDLGFSGAAGAIYRIDVTTPGTSSLQPHYRFEFKGAQAIGTTTATSPSFEEARHTRWYFNTDAGEALDVRMFVTGTLASETIVKYTLTDPLGVETTGTATATASPVSDATFPGYAVASAGTWSLLLDDMSTNANPANGHYGLTKVTGADTGVYLGWESYGEAHVTMDIPAAGVPAEVTFTNTATGETFVFSGVNDGDVLDVPVGSYDVSATGPAGHEVTVSPSTIDLWCTLETELSVEVKNRLPRFTVLLPATLQKNEGPGALELQVAAVDDDGDPLEYVWTVTGPGTAVAHSPTATFTTSADGPSSVVVSVTAFDAYGGTAISQTTIQILNVAPVLGPISGPATPQLVGAAVSVSSTITDPGALDTFTCTINWGDGATTTPLVTGLACGGTHTYTVPDVYTVSMTVTDDDSGSDTEVFKYVVVYSGTGNVTGGGKFDSPAGFYAGQPTLTGRSNFGFNARYDKNGELRGQTEFQFRGLRPVVPRGDRDDDEDDDDDEDAEDRRAGRPTRTRLNFRSTSYDWLIVSGATGMYVGSGRISGSTNDYAFLVSIVDGRPDRFRIKIWDKGTGAVVYDNNASLSDNYADPTFAISRGNVVIR